MVKLHHVKMYELINFSYLAAIMTVAHARGIDILAICSTGGDVGNINKVVDALINDYPDDYVLEVKS